MLTGSWRAIVSGLLLLAAAACGGGSTVEEVAPTVTPTSPTAAPPVTPVITFAPSVSTVAGPTTVTPSPPSSVSVPGPAPGEFAPCDGTSGGVAVGAFVLSSGAPAWRSCSAAEASRSVLGATEDAVYVESTTSEDGQAVTALDARTGAVLWSRAVVRNRWGWPAGPIAGAGVVVLTLDGDAVVGVDALTGAERWRLVRAERMLTPPATPPPSVGPPNMGPPVSPGEPIANTSMVAVLASASGARGIDRATGATLWSLGLIVQDTAGVGVARSPAAVLGETVLLPASDREGAGPAAVDTTTGRQLWRTSTLDHPSAVEGVAVGYLSRDSGPGDAEIVAVSMSDGSWRWSKPGMPSYGDLWALGDGVAVVRTMDAIVAYELASGAQRWRRAGGPDLPGEPQIVAGDRVVLLWEGNLGALSTTTGDTVWASTQPLDSASMSTVAANSTTVFVSVNSRPWAD